jgi:signal transduction histidine kinase/CheY-like chemotaxis protein
MLTPSHRARSDNHLDAAEKEFEPLRRVMSWIIAQSGLEQKKALLRRYGKALAAVVVATIARLYLDPFLHDRGPYTLYLVAIVFVAWRSGWGPSLVTVWLGWLVSNYFFVEPRGSVFIIGGHNQLLQVLNLLVGLGVSLLTASLRMIAHDNARLYRKACEADHRKDEFLAMLSHELRNPLTPIHNTLYLLRSARSDDSEVVRLGGTIEHQVVHLTRLVDELLDVSRITRGKIELRLEVVELQAIVLGAVEMVRPLIDERDQQIEVSVAEQPIFLLADEVRLTQALANLLNNAAKYTDYGGRIWLTALATPRGITLRVRDTGIGLAREMLPRVFNLFEQADSSIERSRGGLGVGLTLVRSLVELHGGSIEADSPGLGFGSEFIIRLPATLVVDQTTPADSQCESRHERSADAKLTVLVVDDDAATVTSIASMLRMWNYRPQICLDGFSALEEARIHPPDVVLTDLGMPQMNGLQLARELRRLPGGKRITLIALSGYGRENDRQRATEAGFDEHLLKPLNAMKLKAALETAALARDLADTRQAENAEPLVASLDD